MDNIGLDLHRRESLLCVLTDGGEILERRIATRPGTFTALLGARARARILLEASTESEWVARRLETLGASSQPTLHTGVRSRPSARNMASTSA